VAGARPQKWRVSTRGLSVSPGFKGRDVETTYRARSKGPSAATTHQKALGRVKASTKRLSPRETDVSLNRGGRKGERVCT